MDDLLAAGVLLLNLAVGALVAREVVAWLSLGSGVTWRDAWKAGTNLCLEPERYLRPGRVVLVRVLTYATALLGILGVVALVAAALRI
jgi:hypothetical protein